MEILKFIYVAVVVLILFGATIFVHELGHFLLARRYKLRIEKFSIGFGPKIWGFTKDGIEYQVGAFPFGGFVALPQMSPLDEEEQKKFDPPIQPASPWAKIVVAVAGAAFNIAFAFLLACFIWWVGKPIDSSELDLTIGYAPKNSIEYKAGLRGGDHIVSINGEHVNDWSDVNQAVAFSRKDVIQIDVLRDGEPKTILMTPDRSVIFGVRLLKAQPRATPRVKAVPSGSPAERAGLRPGDDILSMDGITVLSGGHLGELVRERANKPTEIKVRRDGHDVTLTCTPQLDTNSNIVRIGIEYEPSQQIVDHPNPWKQFKEVVLMMEKTVTALVHHKETGVGAKDLSGPVGIGHMLWTIIPSDIRLAISFTVLLNINLAILNLLPIPVLDGGHIMFALFEWIRRKPLSYKFASITQTVFAVLLVSFILYVTYYDILRVLRIRTADSSQPKEQIEMKFDPAPTTAPPKESTPAVQ